MDDAHQAALRAWEQNRQDLDMQLAVLRAAQRSGRRLPTELDPDQQIPPLVELAQQAYSHLDGGGYVNVAVASRVDWSAPPEES